MMNARAYHTCAQVARKNRHARLSAGIREIYNRVGKIGARRSCFLFGYTYTRGGLFGVQGGGLRAETIARERAHGREAICGCTRERSGRANLAEGREERERE